MPRTPLTRVAAFAALPFAITTTFAASLATPLAAQNQALQFTTGVDAAVEVPFDAAMVPPTGFTVEAWITYDDSTIPTGLYYWPTIARQNVAPGAESWLFRVGASNIGNRNVEFTIRNGLNQLQVLTYAFAPGEFAAFTHLAATYDGQNMAIYKNGVQVSARTIVGAYEVQNNGGILRIGNGDVSTPGRETWNGMIDEVRVWPMPRTAAEITATMNQELSSMPGGVLTFNCNGTLTDSSLGLIGAPYGAVVFAAGPTNLVPVLPLALSIAPATTNCARAPAIALGSVPLVGNSGFAIWCHKGPRPANSPLGVLVAATQAAPASQPPLLGVALAFDLSSILAQQLFIPGTTGQGLQSLPLPIPANPAVAGISLIVQFGFADAACGPQGFTSSNGLVFTVL